MGAARVVEKSGNRTLRIATAVDGDVDGHREIIAFLDGRGLEWEALTTGYVAANVGPLVDLGEIYDSLGSFGAEIFYEAS